jgi:antitoxin component HigA of HigAB toxin-antitoxin module
MSTKTRQSAAVGDDYFSLVRRFPLRTIRTKASHQKAMHMLRDLMRRDQDSLTEGELDYLEALARFVEDYESREPGTLRGTSTPLDRLRHVMEQRDFTQADLSRLIGRSAASDVLRGKRELSKAHIRALVKHFEVSPALFFDAA